MFKWVKEHLKKDEDAIEKASKQNDTLQLRVEEIKKKIATLNGDDEFYLCLAKKKECVHDD